MMNRELSVALLLAKTTLILVAASLFIPLLRRNSAAFRHLLWGLILIGLLVVPFAALAGPSWFLPILPGVASNPLKPFSLTTDPFASSLRWAASEPGDPVSVSATAKQVSVPLPVPKKPEEKQPNLIITSSAGGSPGSALGWPLALGLVWLVGVLIQLARWGGQLGRIKRITRRGRSVEERTWFTLLESLRAQMGIRQTVRLIVSEEISVPMTWGLREPVILLPCDALSWSAERRKVVLLHELAHIARLDYLTQWMALLSCAVYWFHPLVWHAARQAAIERERASDDQVINAGTPGVDYAAHLLEIARNAVQPRHVTLPGQTLGLALARRSEVTRRIRCILNPRQPRRPLSRTGRLAFTLIMIISLLPLSLVRPSRASSEITLTIAVPQGMDQAFASGLLRDFEAAHPGLTLTFTESQDIPDASDGIDAYFAAMQKYANSADILFFDNYRLALTPFATRAGYVLDLAPLMNSDASLNTADFYPQMLKNYQWDNGTWGFPLGGDMVVLNYNKAAFDRAGLTYPDGHWTLADFVNAVTKLTVKDSDGHITATGFANTGRIFRESLWRSLLETDLVDESTIPNTPKFDTPAVASILGAYHDLEDAGLIGGDMTSAAMFVDIARKRPDKEHDWALLPGNHSVILPFGFGISAGSAHPDLAYELLKAISAREELNGGIPVHKSLAGAGGVGNGFAPEIRPLIEQGFANGLSYSNLRFADYLNAAHFQSSLQVQDGLRASEARAISELKTADSKKGTLALAVNEPTAPVLAPGKIALKFDLAGFPQDAVPRELWKQINDDFAAHDKDVGLVQLRIVSEPLSLAANSSDCFYMPTNLVPTLTGNLVLNLDPFLTADPTFNQADYLNGTLAAVQRDNKTFALPIGIEPLVLKYSSAQFQAAGLPEPTNQWAVGDFADALRALKPLAQGQQPFVDFGSDGLYLLVLTAAYGGLPIDYRTSPPTVNFSDPTTVAAIRQTLDLIKGGYIKYTALGGLEQAQPASPSFTTSIYPSRLNSLGRKIAPGTAPDKLILFPHGSQVNGLAFNLGTAYISSQAQNPDACYRYIAMLAKHPELFQTMPARRSVLTDPGLQSSLSADRLALYNQVAALLADPHTVPIPIPERGIGTVTDTLLQAWLFEAFDNYILHDKDLEASLKDAESYAKGFLTCATGLPPLRTDVDPKSNLDTVKPYVECAVKADSRLKAQLDPLIH